MKKIKSVSLFVISLYSIVMCDSKYENIAFCLDSKGIVFRKGMSRNGKVFKGDIIYNGDKITVTLGAHLTIRNIYERSEIKIFEKEKQILFLMKKRQRATLHNLLINLKKRYS